jgi:hypothetical protein
VTLSTHTHSLSLCLSLSVSLSLSTQSSVTIVCCRRCSKRTSSIQAPKGACRPFADTGFERNRDSDWQRLWCWNRWNTMYQARLYDRGDQDVVASITNTSIITTYLSTNHQQHSFLHISGRCESSFDLRIHQQLITTTTTTTTTTTKKTWRNRDCSNSTTTVVVYFINKSKHKPQSQW